MKVRFQLLLIYILILTATSSAFSRNTDSLISILPQLTDSQKIHTLYGIAGNFTYSNPQESRSYTNQAIELVQKRGDTNTIVYARLQTQLGVLEKNIGNFDNAAVYQHKALKLHEAIGDTTDKYKASVYNDLGIIYKTLENWEVALKYYKKSNEMCKKLNLTKGVLMTYNNIGTVLIELNQIDSAEYYYNLAYESAIENNDLGAQALTLNNIGELMVKIGRKSLALENFQKALKIDRQTGDRFGIVFTLMNLGFILKDLEKYKQAEQYLKEGIEIAREQEAKYLMAQTLNTLSVVYESQHKYKEAYEALRETVSLNDSIYNEEKNKQIQELEAKYQNEKKEQEIELQKARLHEQDAELEKKQAEKKMYMYIIILAGVILTGSLWGWNSKRKDNAKLKEKNTEIALQKHIVEEKNKEITDSIHYAKRIQAAILPPDKIVKEHLPDSFILYKPKDIVAGDFYWMESISPFKEESIVLFAACDCTGHGVPGAMVSVVCNNGLNRSVREHKLTDPGKILNKTREIVIKEFEKSEEEVKDGMDIALCSLKQEDGSWRLQYAGANNPLWIVRKNTIAYEQEKRSLTEDEDIPNKNNGFELTEIKADKQPIGKYISPLPYTTHTVKLKQGDTIYIFSDGFADQFGGEKGKKFKTANFKKLLLSIQDEPIDKQGKLIDKAFENWKGNLEQLDDVCIIGVKV